MVPGCPASGRLGQGLNVLRPVCCRLGMKRVGKKECGWAGLDVRKRNQKGVSMGIHLGNLGLSAFFVATIFAGCGGGSAL